MNTSTIASPVSGRAGREYSTEKTMSVLHSAPVAANDSAVASEADRNEATVVYVGGIFTPLVPAILKWAVKQNASPFVKAHVNETLNWGITLLLANIALSIVAVVAGKILALLGLAVSLLGLAIFAYHIYLTLFKGMAAMKRGETYRYPWAVRLIKD
jgi:uncharacterized protein